MVIWLGYESTSNCLAYTSYLLALHPDKQDTLYQEIEKFYQENPVSTSYGGFHPETTNNLLITYNGFFVL